MNTSLLTTNAAADRLAVSPRHVRRMIASGELEAVHLGRSLRIKPDALDKLIERNTVKLTDQVQGVQA